VRWKGYNQSEDSWEPVKNLQGCQELIKKFASPRSPSPGRKARTPKVLYIMILVFWRSLSHSVPVSSITYSCNASVNPPLPPTPPPLALALVLPWMANSWGWALLSCQIPRGGDERRGQMPYPPSTLQHFSLIAQSNNAILSILMCHFLFQLTSSFVIVLGF